MALRFLDAVTATGVSLSYRVSSKDHTIQCTCTGAPTHVTVALEGSLDDATWYTLAEHDWVNEEIAAQTAMFHVTAKVVRYVRLNLSTLSGGTSPTVTALYEQDDVY